MLPGPTCDVARQAFREAAHELDLALVIVSRDANLSARFQAVGLAPDWPMSVPAPATDSRTSSSALDRVFWGSLAKECAFHIAAVCCSLPDRLSGAVPATGRAPPRIARQFRRSAATITVWKPGAFAN